jgi:PAB-dependent poly(A)-specific ribonuclease subunit 2
LSGCASTPVYTSLRRHRFYNKSPYSGLESHIANCYVNPVLQALHYLAPVRALAKAHIVTDCPAERCLLCELGFVARNLEDAHGVNCHAGNFCSTLGLLAQGMSAPVTRVLECSRSEAHGMPDLLDYGRDSGEKNYAQLIQQCARFLLDRLVAEGDAGLANPRLVPADGAHAHSPPAPPITQLAGIPLRTVTGCALCGAAKERPALAHVVDLIYPRAVRPVVRAPCAPC